MGARTTTSTAIADCFRKEHKNVLADIRNLVEQCPGNFTELNFQPSEYTDSTGRKLPMYHIHFDGFILLVMGYTGPKALKMKLAYIEAFNTMRDQLSGKTEQVGNSDRLADSSITPDQQCTLRAIVKSKIDVTGMSKGQIMQLYGQIWSRFSNHFRIARYSQLPQSRMSEAVEYLTKLELTQKKKIEKQAALPQGFPPLAERGAEAMANLLKLRVDLFTNSLAIQRVMETALHHNNEDNLSETQKEFSRTMNKSVGAFFMSINHNLIAIEEMFKAFMEAEKMIYG